ncbi:MAG: gluconokinase [Candidatus Limnocylindrales bacterium]
MSATRPKHVVIMGVAGSGKTAVAEALARLLEWSFIEGDAVHPPANIAKMSAGIALTDADRGPWLAALAAMTAEHDARGISTVVACSALRRSYRDILRSGVPDGETFFIHLDAAPDVLAQRMRDRSHFMPPELLESQLRTLEPLETDELGVTIDVTRPLDQVVAEARASIATRYDD